MTQKEFEDRTGFVMPSSLYELVEKDYYNSNLDKDEFCKMWVKNGGIKDFSFRMVAIMDNLYRELQQEKDKRVLEREHAERELTRVINKYKH